MKYETIIYWSEEDNAYIAEAHIRMAQPAAGRPFLFILQPRQTAQPPAGHPFLPFIPRLLLLRSLRFPALPGARQ